MSRRLACGFPFAGYGNRPADVYGYYWSSTDVSNNNAYYLTLLPTSKSVTSGSRGYGCSVRCVRRSCASTGSPSFLGSRAAVVSRRLACGFPFAGTSAVPGGVYGYYWSSTDYGGGYAYYLNLAPTSKSVTHLAGSYGCSVRCVRRPCASTGSPSFLGSRSFMCHGFFESSHDDRNVFRGFDAGVRIIRAVHAERAVPVQ